MRNSEARRYARWAALVAALLLAGVVTIYLRHAWQVNQVEKKAPPPIPATVEQQSADFSYSKVEGRQTVFTVRASRATAYKGSSQNLLEDVSISVFGRMGERNDSLVTKACDFNSTSGGIDCEGDVQMLLRPANALPSDKNIVRATTSKVKFNRDSGAAVTDAPIGFEWPSGAGTAIGASYNASDGILSLAHSVQLDLVPSLHPNPAAEPEHPHSPQSPSAEETTPEAADKKLHLDGNALVFNRIEHTVVISGMVHARQASHEITAENFRLELDAALHARHLVATGNPRLRDSETSGSFMLDAKVVSAAIDEEGRIQTIQADGEVHGNRDTGADVEQVDAGHLQVDLLPTGNAPRLLTASGGVVLTSHVQNSSSPTRRIETAALELHFADARLGQKTRVESLNSLAPARVEERRNVTSKGATVSQTTRMSGRQTNLKFDEDNRLLKLVSSGDVLVSRQTGNGPEQKTTSRDLIANFSAGEWATIDQSGDVQYVQGTRIAQGTSAHIDRASEVLKLTGPAVLSDGATRTTAATVIFIEGSEELRADGGVVTTDNGGGTASLTNLSSTPGHISADHLIADPAHGHALYTGRVRLWQGSSVIEADRVDLDKASPTLVAVGNVRGVFPQAPPTDRGTPAVARSAHAEVESSHVSGDKLTYWGAESRARLEPNAKVESPEGSMEASQLDLYFSPAGSGTQQIERAVATGHVMVQQEGRRGTSNQAEYSPAEGKFVLSGGSPTLYDTNGDTTTGRELTFYFADDTINIDSDEGSRTVTLHRIAK